MAIQKLELDPVAREAIRYYTDPLLPTYGVRTKAAAAAGCGARVLDRPEVQREIERILSERQKSAGKVVEYLASYTMDAARELINQLSSGRELEIRDPSPILQEGITEEEIHRLEHAISGIDDPIKVEAIVQGVVAGKLKRAEAMIAHNKTVLQAVKERRAAAVEIVRQQIGTPEQRIRVTRDNDPTPLQDLSDDKLKELGSLIEETMLSRQPNEIPEAEVEYLD